MLAYTACDCLGWALRYLGDCVCSSRDLASLVCGLVSIALWGVSEVPQLVANFVDGRSEGVSDVFLLTWTIGDFLNVAGCIFSNTLPTQLYTALLYTTITLCLDAQHIYYAHLLPRWSRPRKDHQPPRIRHPVPSTTAGGTVSPRVDEGPPMSPPYSVHTPLLTPPEAIDIPPASPSLDGNLDEAGTTSHYGSLRSMSSFHSLRPPLLSTSLTRTLSHPNPPTPHPSPNPYPHYHPNPPPSNTTFCTASTGLEPAASSWTSQGWGLDSGDDTTMGIIGHMDDFPPHHSGITPQSSTANTPAPSTTTTPHSSPPGGPTHTSFGPMATHQHHQQAYTGAQGPTGVAVPVGTGTANTTAPVPWPSRSTTSSDTTSSGGRGPALQAAAPATLLALYLVWSSLGPSTDHPVLSRPRSLLVAPTAAQSTVTPQHHVQSANSSSTWSWRAARGPPGGLLRLGSSNHEHAVWGQVLGWSMTAVYVSGRLPQILKNHRRKSTAGLSVEMFAMVIAANLTYTLSILIRSTAWVDIKPRLPWLVDACLCLLADFVIMGQVVWFRHVRSGGTGSPPHSMSLSHGPGSGAFSKHSAHGGYGGEAGGLGQRQGSGGSGGYCGYGGGQYRDGRERAPAGSRQDVEENYNRVMVAQHV